MESVQFVVKTIYVASGHHEHSPQEQAEQLQNLMAEIRHLQKYGVSAQLCSIWLQLLALSERRSNDVCHFQTRRTRRYLNKMNLVDNPTKEDIERMISACHLLENLLETR